MSKLCQGITEQNLDSQSNLFLSVTFKVEQIEVQHPSKFRLQFWRSGSKAEWHRRAQCSPDVGLSLIQMGQGIFERIYRNTCCHNSPRLSDSDRWRLNAVLQGHAALVFGFSTFLKAFDLFSALRMCQRRQDGSWQKILRELSDKKPTRFFPLLNI